MSSPDRIHIEDTQNSSEKQVLDAYIQKSEPRRLMSIGSLENWLWEAACSIRGPVDAPKFKDYILPLVFIKRLSEVFEDEIGKLSNEFGEV
jgi:type I restriction-modification system DNA methylase subunit